MEQVKLLILKQIFPDFEYRAAKKEFVTKCPEHDHHKRKLEISLDSDIFHCWVCDFKGRTPKLIKKYGTKKQFLEYLKLVPVRSADVVEEKRSVDLPEDFTLFQNASDSFLGGRIKMFLEQNGISELTAKQNLLGVSFDSPFRNRLIIPSRDLSGQLNFFTARALFDSTFPKFMSCEGVRRRNVIFNEIFLSQREPFVLVEGEKSYLKHFSVGNIVCLNGSIIREDYSLFSFIVRSGQDVFLALDEDAKEKSLEIANLFAQFGISVYLVDVKDQPDKMTTDEFEHALSFATRAEEKSLLETKISNL